MGEDDGYVGEDDTGVSVDRRHTMMSGAAFRRHRERGGESPPPSSSLTSSLDGRRVSPLVHGLHGGGGVRAPPRLDLSLSLCVSFCFCAPRFCVSPFLKFQEIRNSDWAKILTWFAFGYYLSCRERRAPTALRSGHKPASRHCTSWWRRQGLWALRASPRVDSSSQKS